MASDADVVHAKSWDVGADCCILKGFSILTWALSGVTAAVTSDRAAIVDVMAGKVTKKTFPKKGSKQPVRLYAKGVILGYKCTLLKIDGVRTKDDTKFYVGKRVAYVYKAKKEIQNSKFRVMWGKIRRSHGNSGVVRAKFNKNIPPQAFGAACRVMLYPSSI